VCSSDLSFDKAEKEDVFFAREALFSEE
jgi:hypothetical protein